MTGIKSTFEDLRFGSVDGLIQYPYWIESVSGNIAKAWVKIPYIPANSSTGITMYYGSQLASSASNGESTFDFFDGFDGSTLDVSKWRDAIVGGAHNYSFSNSIMTMTSASTTDYAVIDTVSSFGTSYSLRVRGNIDATGTTIIKQKNIWWNAAGDSPDKILGFGAAIHTQTLWGLEF